MGCPVRAQLAGRPPAVPDPAFALGAVTFTVVMQR